MRAAHVYWQIYRREQIKPELRGRLIYVLEIPPTPGSPLLRHVFDPTGMEFPTNPGPSITSFLTGKRNGLIFDGVSKSAVYDMRLSDPRSAKCDADVNQYNGEVVRNCQQFFLTTVPELSRDRNGARGLMQATV